MSSSVRANVEAFDFARSSHEERLAQAKMLFDTGGATNDVVELIRKAQKKILWYQKPIRSRFKCILANVYAARGDWAGVCQVLDPLLEKMWPQVGRYSSIASLSILHDSGFHASQITKECSDIMKISDSRLVGIMTLLSDPTKTIAVVGNSPIQVGTDAGSEIDSHDVVIRFNNYSVDSHFARDYGRKSTIWVKSGGYTDLWRRPLGAYEYVIFSGPDRRFHGSQAWDFIEIERAGGRATVVPARTFVDLVKAVDRIPSAGLLMLHWLRTIRGPFSSCGVSTYGFKMSDQVDDVKSQYFSGETKGRVRHDWAAEAAYMKTHILA